MLKDIINVFLEFIYPDNISCIICDLPINKENTYSMCKNCFEELHFILDACVKCGKPINNNSLEKQDISGCGDCLKKNFYFDKAISCVEYTEFSKKIIFGFKYNNKTYMSRYVAYIMKEKLDIENIKFDYIIPVPLYRKRYKKRGFNQSEKIARYLGQIIDRPVTNAILRIENTKQLYSLNKKERKDELKDAFILSNNKENLNNKSVLIIDDIFTTGSTVNEISKVLKLNGVNKVFVITFLTKPSKSYIME